MLIDRRSSPGGHWNDPYPFVRLHQPKATYGVASTPLGTRRVDTQGWKAGLFDLASGPKIVADYDQLMRGGFHRSGRGRFLPMTDYSSDRRLHGLLLGERQEVLARRRIVDATYLGTRIRATHRCGFHVADDAACITPNDLP